MIIGAIIVGIAIFAVIILGFHFSDNGGSNFDLGMSMGVVISIFAIIEIGLVADIIGKPTPTALDVYRGNTELEITSVNGTPIDKVVVFKKN
jgi:hypothetical protein